DRPRVPIRDEDDAFLHAGPGDSLLRGAHGPRDVRGRRAANPRGPSDKRAPDAAPRAAVPRLEAAGLGQVPGSLLQPRVGHPVALGTLTAARDLPPVPRHAREG